MKSRLSAVLAVLAVALLGAGGCAERAVESRPAVAKPPGDRRVANLTAFARLYGYVKYFHPSDEAAALDWKAFAVHGASQVLGARDAGELAKRLRRLFAPVAPTLRIARGATKPDNPVTAAPERSGDVVVAWQHRGPGLDDVAERVRTYRSVRVNRPAALERSEPGCVAHELDKTTVAGKRIRVRAWIRGSKQAPTSVHVTAKAVTRRVEPASAYQSPPLDVTADWARYEYERPIPADAFAVYAGVCLYYAGSADVDDVGIEVFENGSWRALALSNAGFEAGDTDWDMEWSGYDVQLIESGARTGKRAARVARTPGMPPGAIFREHAKAGERAQVSLGGGLVAHVPLALWSRAGHSVPRGNASALKAALAAVSTESAQRRDVRLGVVVTLWNVLEHFYPYFDVVRTDWNRALDEALKRALRDGDERAFATTLETLIAHLADGHAIVRHASLRATAVLPLSVDWVGDQLVVTTTGTDLVAKGETITAIDGESISTWRRRQDATTSGSPQWKRQRARWSFVMGKSGTQVQLTVRSMAGNPRTVRLTRGKHKGPSRPPKAAIRELRSAIQYVDLSRATWAEIRAVLPKLASARAVIFDLRGYPKGNHEVLRHLLPRADERKWMFVAQTAYPRRMRAPRWLDLGWNMAPAQPRIGGKVIFLTDESAISYAESVMGFVEGYKLGAIVGSPTAGANGNVKLIGLPAGFSVSFTGMKVLKHDGSRLHGIGIAPTHPVRPTLAGIRAGRDEVLERALELASSR